MDIKICELPVFRLEKNDTSSNMAKVCLLWPKANQSIGYGGYGDHLGADNSLSQPG